MKRSRGYARLLALLVITVFLAGCGSSSSSTPAEPFETQDVSGVWVGYIGDTFAVGIITEDDVAQFIGQDTSNRFNLFISPSVNDPLHVASNSVIFSGDLDLSVWDTSGLEDYKCLALQSGTITSTVATKSMIGAPFGIGGGSYTLDNQNAVGVFLIYNTTYDVTPNVRNLLGTWEMEHAWQFGNTLTLTITSTGTSTSTGSISGVDTNSKHFTGTISIHVSNPQKNVYDVSLNMTEAGISLDGLAAYVAQMNTDGIDRPATLAIGATNTSKTYSLTGLATRP